MAIDSAEVRRIADLACLELDPKALELLRGQLGSILDYVARLEELDAEPAAVSPDAAASQAQLRSDEPVEGLEVDEALGNAPDAARGHFRVPRVLGG